ncbi:hypothetical protein YY92_09030 [Campylobacter fetus]|uniref:hypothetical protein n=1 Tax=Campylobacter fetus TaxID=196 RepID=UPI0011C7C7F2|nr:hypothetical protein [Campylobacter fetus]EAJ1232665.1 hypothetical protein [Campylobacter fetus]EAK0414852.1 hypothetical protein [Campylobacter fetus]TXF08803.1 hypothetical protein FPD25_03705 [Campylobacter fetus subsp. fetus]
MYKKIKENPFLFFICVFICFFVVLEFYKYYQEQLDIEFENELYFEMMKEQDEQNKKMLKFFGAE